MCRDWWTAYDQSGNVIADWALNKDKIAGMKINWKIQKNRRNNEPLSYKRDLQNKTFCVPRAIISMAERAERLGQAQDLPLAVYEKNGEMVYLTARKLTAYLRLLARAKPIQLGLTKRLQRYQRTLFASGLACFCTRLKRWRLYQTPTTLAR